MTTWSRRGTPAAAPAAGTPTFAVVVTSDTAAVQRASARLRRRLRRGDFMAGTTSSQNSVEPASRSRTRPDGRLVDGRRQVLPDDLRVRVDGSGTSPRSGLRQRRRSGA